MKKRGFSLLETIVVLSVAAVLSASGFSAYKFWQNKNNLAIGKSIVVQALIEAGQASSAGISDSNWGVKYQPGKVILFSGSSYAARNAGQDKSFSLPAGVYLTGLDEIIFNKFSGLPLSTPAINIFYGNESRQIIISAQGVFSS